ncbi:hypothetical protein AgCh_022783 [Apium graveolens]
MVMVIVSSNKVDQSKSKREAYVSRASMAVVKVICMEICYEWGRRGSGAMFSLVSGMGGPNTTANVVISGLFFALVQGGLFKVIE